MRLVTDDEVTGKVDDDGEVPAGPVHRPRVSVPMVVGVALVVLALGVGDTLVDALREDHTVGNMHALQADAFLHGDLALSRAVEDVARYDGEVFSPYPPAPAMLLLPFVAVFGLHGPLPTLVALVLTAVGAWLAFRICTRLGVERRSAVLLVVGLFLGTAYWFCVIWSKDVWGFAHVVAVTSMLAAFDSALRGRAFWTGVFLGLAVLSRQLSICAFPFLLVLMLDNSPKEQQPVRVLKFAIPVVILVMAYCALNAARFSGPLDTGYSYIPLRDFLQERVDAHGLFSLSYVPFNFIYMFVQGFHLDYAGPDLLSTGGPDVFGTSLTFASPFLFFALLAREKRRIMVAAWGAVLACLIGELLYYNNGYAQINGQRFALDFIPLLFVLLIWGISRARTKLWQGAVVFAVSLNFFALVIAPQWSLVDRVFIS